MDYLQEFAVAVFSAVVFVIVSAHVIVNANILYPCFHEQGRDDIKANSFPLRTLEEQPTYF
jgi:hypothetical protein